MSETEWGRREQRWRAKSLAALQELYGHGKPGHNPKGIEPKVRARSELESTTPKESESQE